MYFEKSGIFVVGLSLLFLKGDSNLGVRSYSPAVRCTMSAFPRRCCDEITGERHRRGCRGVARTSVREEVVRGAIWEGSGTLLFAVDELVVTEVEVERSGNLN